MFCPNYKLREVFDGFNKMVEAFGGRPMTEEEFRDSDLRNLRTGPDYSAMEAAYITYNRNGGNFLDATPLGKPSILFQTLLSYFNGDEKAAIIAKSNVYSDEFFNWFGDWTIENKELVSKVVDDNGEPLVVWHGGARDIEEFMLPKNTEDNIEFTSSHNIEWAKKLGFSISKELEDFYSKYGYIEGTVYKPVGIYFAKDQVVSRSYFGRRNEEDTALYPVYLNIKQPSVTNKNGKLMSDDSSTVTDLQNAIDNNSDGVIIENVRDFGPNDKERINPNTNEFITDPTTDYIVFNPNQIKHVENLGTFSPKDNNIYHLKVEDESLSSEESRQFEATSVIDSFGEDSGVKLLDGETVSSKQLVRAMISNGIFDESTYELAKVLSQHDVPVRVGFSMTSGELAETITDGNASVILVNPNEIRRISRGYFGVAMMHELVHAITVDIIDHPKTEEDREFVRQNKKMFTKLNNFFKKEDAIMFDGFSGLYALSNEKEFAASFASDPAVRHQMFELADALDRVNKTKLVYRLKKFINSVVRAILNRSVFDTTTTREQLESYKNTLTKYLYNAPIIKNGNIPSKSKLRSLINAVDNKLSARELFIESVKRLEQMTNALRNFVLLGRESFRPGNKPKRNSVLVSNWGVVKDALSTRIDALRSSKTDDAVTKSRLIQITQSQLDLFTLESAGMYYAVQNLLDTSIPQIIEDVDKLRGIRMRGDEFSNKDYMDYMHTNLSMYNSVFETIKKMLDDEHNVTEMVSLFNSGVTKEDDKISVDDVVEIKRHLENASSFTIEGMNVCEYMLKENIIHKFKQIADKVGAPDMALYIDCMQTDDPNNFAEDIGALQVWAGSPDAASNEAIRALTYIIQKSLTTATYNSASVATDLLKLQKNLAKGEKEWHIYETDEKGNFTGYLIRDLNFGKFYKNYEKELRRINKGIRDHFNIPDHSLDCRIAPSYDKKAIIDGVELTAGEYFTQEREKWLNKNAERRYQKTYYDFYANLPQGIKDALANIRIEINAITSKYPDLYDKDGVPHYEQLTEEDWTNINVLWERRRALRSDYDEYGNLKTGKDLEDSRKLRAMYDELYNKINPDGTKKKKKYKLSDWENARNKMVERYGEDSEEVKSWDERNTRKNLKKNSYDEAIVFKKIEEEFAGVLPDYGEEYKKLNERRNELLNNYRAANGEVDVNSMPEVIKNIITEIDSKRARIRKEKSTEAAKKYYEIMDKYVIRKHTRQFEKIYKQIEQAAERKLSEYDSDDLFGPSVEDIMYSMLNETYGYYIGQSDDLFGTDLGTFIPYSYLTRIEARDKEYMVYEPNDAWIDKAENDLLNSEFKEEYGVAWVPKRYDEHGNVLYDNTENFEKITGSTTLNALYKRVLEVIQESNDLYGRQYADNYLLPQRECTFLGKLRRSSFWGPTLKKLLNALKIWKWGKIDEDEFEIGVGSILHKDDEPTDMTEGEKEIEDVYGYRKRVSGTYPDGRPFRIIPQYFTKRLKYPQFISRNIVDSAASYYAQAQLYSQRQAVKDDCESIVDMLKMQRFKESGKDNAATRFVKSVGGLNSDLSNTYQYARQIVDRDLYDILRFDVHIPYANRTINISKLLGGWKRWTTARNLGLNPKVAIVGFLTTSFTHILNGLVGYKYGYQEMWKANNIVLKELGKSIFLEKTFIGSRLSKSRLILLLEMMDMSSQLSRKTEHSNRNRFMQALYKNSTFGLLSAADFCSKAVIMTSTLLSYRYVNGQFLTKHQIEESKEALGDLYESTLKAFNESNTTAWDIFLEGKETLEVMPEYKEAWEKIRHTVINKSVKNAEQADGMATRLQKAMMTRNFIGAFALIHRQYIPLMLQQTWGKRVYDYDAEEYKNGLFRTMFLYLLRLCASNALAAGGFGAIVGVGFGGFGLVPLITSTGATAYSLYLKFNQKARGVENRRGFKQSVKDKEFFNKQGSAKDVAYSTANKYQIKLTILEIMLINCFIAPLANLMGAIADDWDKRDKITRMVLQSLAYVSRAFQFESNAKYNLLDISNNLKTFTAGTAITDSGTDLLSNLGSLFGGVISNTALNIFHINTGTNKSSQITAGIYEAFATYSNDAEDDIVKRGAYKNWTRGQRAAFKLFPVHNLYEQILDPESKRRYQENQVMRLNKDDKRSLIYEAWKDKDPAILLDVTDW